VYLVPIMATALVNCPERKNYNLSSLTRIVIGRRRIFPTLIREVEEAFVVNAFSGYGLTKLSDALAFADERPIWNGRRAALCRPSDDRLPGSRSRNGASSMLTTEMCRRTATPSGKSWFVATG